MKKLFALLAVALGVVACQKDQADMGVNLGGEQEVMINVSLPDETRAGSEFGAFKNDVLEDYDLRYILEIYLEDDDTSNDSKKFREVKYSNATTVSFPVRLAPGRAYNFVVWADFVEKDNHADLFYKTSDGLDEISILNGAPMTEARDAFYGNYTLAANDHVANMGAITLTRPFAKIRVVTTDVKDLTKVGVALPTNAKVTYQTPINNKFNALTGEASSDNATVEYPFIYANSSYTDAEGEMTLFADYLFVNAGATTKFVLTVTDHVTKSFNTEIPVVANQVTTIKGDILTNGSDINVEVNPDFGGDNDWPDENNVAEQLAAAAMFGGEVTLTEDVALTQPLEIVEGAKVVINLNGKTINAGLKQEGRHHYAIDNYGTLTLEGEGAINARGIENFGTMTINGNITITNVDTNGGSAIWNEGNLVINGGTFTTNAEAGEGSKGSALNTQKDGSAVINGGNFTAYSQLTYAILNYGETVINNATVKGKHGAVGSADGAAKTTIKGGSFELMENPGVSDHCTYYVSAIYGGTFSLGNNTDSGAKVFCESKIAPGHYALQYEAGKYTVQAIDAASRTLTINSKEDLLKLNTLNDKWNEFFSNGQGTDITDFWTQNGGKGADFYYKWEWTIKLAADIDFEGATLNAPIKMAGFGCFDGQNHTIKNVTIENDTDAGLFISSGYGALKNIKLDNVHAIGGYNGNSTVGILASDCSAGIDNINITNSSAEGGKYTGGVVGYGYTYVTNCTLTNCVVKGGYKCGGVIGYICASDATGHNVTGNTLTNCTVVAATQHADGKSEYVLGMVVGNYNCNGTCANNTVYDMTTTATKIIGKIEAGNVVNESNNVVTYVVENYDELKAAIINGGNIEFANDITVDEWIMFSEDLNVATGDIITVKDINVSIDGKGHKLTVNSIESAGNNDQLFQGADVLNISNLTIKYADGLTYGGLGLDSGVIKNVHFIGGGSAGSSAAIFPKSGEIKVEDCIFDTNGVAFYFDNECDNLTVTRCTFNQKADKNVILLRGDVKFTDNTINSGRTVNVVSGSPVVTGNDFNDVRFKVYSAATATISNNIINNLEIQNATYASTFTANTLSSEAQAALNAATKVN